MTVRKPAVAGKFYPSSKKELNAIIEKILNIEKKHIDINMSNNIIIGGIVPHAGYMFSAYQAVHFFEIIKNYHQKFDTIFIINPNHTGYGIDIALDDNQYWESPYGKVEIDVEFYKQLNFPVSEISHKYEHSGEVMLPLLQYFLKYDFKIVPITIGNQNIETAKKIANEIYNLNEKLNKKILIIASSDFSHFVNPIEGKQLDDKVVEQIKKNNSTGVYETIKKNNISVCGYGPIMTLIEYAKLVSNKPKNKILKQGHSGQIIESNEVVDYISMIFYS